MKVSFLLAAVVVAGCECGPPEAIAGDVCGTGKIDGTDYAIEESELVLTVSKVDAFGCGALHSHVVQAKLATFEYDLNGSAAGEIKITVPAVGLDPDDAALRRKYLPAGDNDPLSDGDRSSIKGSVLEEVKGSEFAALTFTLKNLSTLEGEGTAKLVADIAGENSEVDVEYEAVRDGDKVKITGSAEIDGEPHGIPRNALGFCVEPVMGLFFELTLVPGVGECDDNVVEIPPFEEQFFDDQECGDIGFNVVYNNVIGPRCVGCHGGTLPNNPDLLRGGATVPLNEWRDFRVDSPRNVGIAMYLKAHEYVNIDPFAFDELPMPPGGGAEATLLSDFLEPVVVGDVTFENEKALFDAWVEDGLGRDAQCDNDVEKKTFGFDDGKAIEPGACTGNVIRFDTQQAANDGASAADFVNLCVSCHSQGHPLQAPSAAIIATFDADSDDNVINFAAAELPVTHPFYIDSEGTPLSFWEASIHRADDGSMSPGASPGGFDGIPEFEAFKAWVLAGYCPPE